MSESSRDAASSFDDMYDWPEIEFSTAPIKERLASRRVDVEAVYSKANKRALGYQKWHRRITVISAFGGTMAVLFAIVQLSGLFPQVLGLWFEFCAAVIAILSVGLGLISAFQLNWLLERHKAERCRLLKFGLLVDPVVWNDFSDNAADRLEKFGNDVAAVSAISRRNMDEWIEDDRIPDVPSIPLSNSRIADALPKLAAFYSNKRLSVQKSFFFDRWSMNRRRDRWIHFLPPAFFFLSVLFAFAHFAYDIVSQARHVPGSEHLHSNASIVLIALAAALPVVGAGVRTYRTAYEFARNTIRYRAKYVALEHLATILKEPMSAAQLFHVLWCSEQILESEHREWLRLMRDAEWFG